jgi:hypothetical protein
MLNDYWRLIVTDFGFIGGITAAIAIFTFALARKEERETQSRSDNGDREALRRAS